MNAAGRPKNVATLPQSSERVPFPRLARVGSSLSSMRIALVVVGQRVVAEIGGEVAPHRVDVVGVVLRVVVLDQRDRSVHAEIMGLARRQRARPGEAEAAEFLLRSRAASAPRARSGASVPTKRSISASTRLRAAPSMAPTLEAARLAEIALAARAGDDLAERAIGDDRGAPLLFGEPGHDLARQVLGGAQRPQALVRTVAHRRGMGADEERRHRDMPGRRQRRRSATGDGPRSASPRGSGRACRTPRRSSGRDRGSCPAARAARLRAGARCREVCSPSLVQDRGEQRPRRRRLRRPHLAQGQARSAARDVMPVEPIARLEGDQRLAGAARRRARRGNGWPRRRCAGRRRRSGRWRRRTAGRSPRQRGLSAGSAWRGRAHGHARADDRARMPAVVRHGASRSGRVAAVLQRAAVGPGRGFGRPACRPAPRRAPRGHTAWPSECRRRSTTGSRSMPPL